MRVQPAQSGAVEYRFAAMGQEAARAIAGWRYEGVYARYNCPPEEAEAAVRALVDPESQYFAAYDAAGVLAGYCCFGQEARVTGGDYADESALDVGLGLRPDLTGEGRGPGFVAAVAALADAQLHQHSLRLTVAGWNQRAIRAYQRAGFGQTHRFLRPAPGGGIEEWVQLTRERRQGT